MAEQPSAPARLLVVDDEVGVRRLIETVLGRAGFVVEPAVTGPQALEKLRSEQYDLVILDLGLPWLHGVEVLATMREDPRTARLPVIVITGSHVADTQFDRYEPVALIRKPFEPDTLIAAVTALLQSNRGA